MRLRTIAASALVLLGTTTPARADAGQCPRLRESEERARLRLLTGHSCPAGMTLVVWTL